jgi:hypothetical protein
VRCRSDDSSTFVALIEAVVDHAPSWQPAGVLPTELALLTSHPVAIRGIDAALCLLVSMLVSPHRWMYDATLSPSGIDSVWRTSVASSDPLGMGRRTDPFGVAARVGGTNPARLCVAVLEHSLRAVALRALRLVDAVQTHGVRNRSCTSSTCTYGAESHLPRDVG